MVRELIFIGGGDYRKEENLEIDKYLLTKISKDSKILIIPFATDKSKYVSWSAALFNNFKKYDLKHWELVDLDLPPEIIKQQIQHSDVLFLTGGLPNLLMENFEKKEVTDIIKTFKGIIIGYSAGALVLSKDCVILPEEGHPGAEIIKGLNLAKFSTYVHYSSEHDIYLKKFSKSREIYAITNQSALIYDGKIIKGIGEIYLFKDGIKTKF